MKQSVLVVAAHPDDEILGCGGTIAHHAGRGDRVDVLIVAQGVSSRSPNRRTSVRKLTELAQCAKTANKILGVKSLTLKQYPDNKLDTVPRLSIIKEVEACISRRKPDLVYTHQSSDLNVDHRRVHEAVITACRPLPGTSVRTILFFEIASSTEWASSHGWQVFSPTWFVDISASLNRKLRALEAYAPELREFPHPRSLAAVEHLARWRGATAGVAAAEAFMVGRNLVK